MLKKEFKKNVSYVYIWDLVASWACEAIAILAQKKLPLCFFV